MTALPDIDLAALLALIGSAVFVTIYMNIQNKKHNKRIEHEDFEDI